MRVLRALRPSPATVIATVALMVALAGTGYAATSLPANSVGPTQLQSNAVTTSKVKNFSLLKVDFAPNQIPRGPRGPQGLPGPPGPAGAKGPTGPVGSVATQWALVGRDGNLVSSSTGVTVIPAGPGQYYVHFPTPVAGHAVTATQAFRNGDPSPLRGSITAAVCGSNGTTPADTISCILANNNTNTVYVTTMNQGNTSAEGHAFYLVIV